MNAQALQSFLISQIDTGILVVDEHCNIVFVNRFIETHSGKSADSIVNVDLFDAFPELPKNWLKRKLQGVFMLNTPAFSSWEQRQFLFQMPHTRPITTDSEYMAQNCTVMPMQNEQGHVDHACILIEDATDVCYYQKKLSETLEKLEESNRTDGLTKIANRRFWEERFAHEFESAKRYGHQLSLIMFDLDKFKNINDTFGHQVGDTVLIETAKLANNLLRQTDLLGRYGGEEFGILLSNTGMEGAGEVAERIRCKTQTNQIKVDKESIFASISMGVVEMAPNHKTYEDMITRADMALYQSKREGRNRVTVYRT